MKRFLMTLICLMAMFMASCTSSTWLVTAECDVCYLDGTRTYTNETIVTSRAEPIVVEHSFGGTNYLSVVTTQTNLGEKTKGVTNLKSSTAPIRLNDYKAVPTKAKRQYANTNSDSVYR